MMDAIEKAAQALAQLSDAEWTKVKRDEERRRAQMRVIRNLSREHRDREPAR